MKFAISIAIVFSLVFFYAPEPSIAASPSALFREQIKELKLPPEQEYKQNQRDPNRSASRSSSVVAPSQEPSPLPSLVPSAGVELQAETEASMSAESTDSATLAPSNEPTITPAPPTVPPPTPTLVQSRTSVQQTAAVKPDTIISVDLETLKDSEVTSITTELEELQNKGKPVSYVDTGKNNVIFFFAYDSQSETGNLQSELGPLTSVTVSENRKYTVQYTPNDPFYAQQWNLTNLDYSRAMAIGPGTAQPVIGIIDSGVNIGDVDLNDNIWNNTGETYGDGIDNDANGYIDDRYGCNFVEHNNGNEDTACLVSALYNASSTHGTRVANLIATETNNGVGTAAICPTCKIMVLDVDDSTGARLSDVITAIYYAVDNGAHVVNFSYASACPFDASQDVLASYLNNAVNTDNLLYVQSAGNSGSMTQSQCIATCGSSNTYCNSTARNQSFYYVDGKNVDNLFHVGATTQAEKRASFSAYNGSGQNTVNIAAPGDSVPVNLNGSLTTTTGTSFSAPQVSAAIGLALSWILPNRTPEPSEIVTLITNTAKEISTDQNISGKQLQLFKMMNVAVARELIYNTDYIFVSRFYSSSNASHFFTGSDNEAQIVREDYPDSTWNFEGIAYYAFGSQVPGTVPLYRFYSNKNATHFYTANEEEKKIVIDNYDDETWLFEGVAYYVYPLEYTGGSSRTVYRFWSNKLKRHFFTANEDEKQNIINNLSGTYEFEGAAWQIPNL